MEKTITLIEWYESNEERITGLAAGKELSDASTVVQAIVPEHAKSRGAWATLGIYHCIRRKLLVLGPLGSYKGTNYIGFMVYRTPTDEPTII